MSLNESPIGVYADVTGIVNATAAAEIVALIAVLASFIASAQDGSVPASPDFGNIPISTAVAIKAELDALAAAIAAAPTA